MTPAGGDRKNHAKRSGEKNRGEKIDEENERLIAKAHQRFDVLIREAIQKKAHGKVHIEASLKAGEIQQVAGTATETHI